MLLQNSIYRPAASVTRDAFPIDSEGTVDTFFFNCFSMANSTSSGSLVPLLEKNFMPLSAKELWEALITMPAWARSVRVR